MQDFRIIYRILKILQQSMDLTKPNIHTRGRLWEYVIFDFGIYVIHRLLYFCLLSDP